jgi:hypothetical protein
MRISHAAMANVWKCFCLVQCIEICVFIYFIDVSTVPVQSKIKKNIILSITREQSIRRTNQLFLSKWFIHPEKIAIIRTKRHIKHGGLFLSNGRSFLMQRSKVILHTYKYIVPPKPGSRLWQNTSKLTLIPFKLPILASGRNCMQATIARWEKEWVWRGHALVSPFILLKISGRQLVWLSQAETSKTDICTSGTDDFRLTKCAG